MSSTRILIPFALVALALAGCNMGGTTDVDIDDGGNSDGSSDGLHFGAAGSDGTDDDGSTSDGGTIDDDGDGGTDCQDGGTDDGGNSDGGSTTSDGGSSSSDGGSTGDDGSSTTDGGTDCDEQTWYADNDRDGYGNVDYAIVACDQPDGYVDNDDDYNDDTNAIGDVVEVWVVATNGYAFELFVQDLSSVHWDQSHWYTDDPLIESSDSTWQVEYPNAQRGDELNFNGLGTTIFGYGDDLVYACGGLDGDAVYYDGDVTCAVIEIKVNGNLVDETTHAVDGSYNFRYVIE